MKKKKRLKKNHKKTIFNILLLCLIIIFVCSTYKYLSIMYYRDKNKKVNDKIIKEVVSKDDETKEIKINLKKLKRINKDVIGWIRIPKTHINYPILQTTDNSYYLNHDIYGDYNINGSIFMNYKNRYDFSDFNTIIFGHHTRTSEMFSDLEKMYEDKISIKSKIYIYTEKKRYIFVPYSMYLADSNDEKPLNPGKSFFSKTEKDFNIDLDKKSVKQTLTLSTCYDNNSKRIILHAYLNSKE